ncbi:hypothetical protein AX16_007045 [Volvariella volvacea WC 439]|nr:hypothetical protein AX16_007045 [Volvariella volvacea WC 439]
MSTSANVPDSDYPAKPSPDEKDRLEKQYKFCQKIFNQATAVPKDVDPSKVRYVMELAAGSLSWILDFASIPEVKARLDSKVDPIELYASDITDGNFPPSDIVREHRINTFLHDITKPFPDELLGKFDLVHFAFTVGVLSTRGWEKTMKNISDLLRPGGYLHWRDAEGIWYPDPGMVPKDPQSHDFERATMGNSSSSKFNRLFYKMAKERDFVLNPSAFVPTIIEPVHLRLLRLDRAIYPWGKHCELCKSVTGEDLSDAAESTVQGGCYTFDHLTKGLLQACELEETLGIPIKTEEERLQLVEETACDIKENGTCLAIFDSLIQKVVA